MNNASKTFAEDLCQFIDQSPTAVHAVATMEKILEKRNFTRVSLESHDWPNNIGGYYVISGGCLIAWYSYGIPTKRELRLVAAHTDSPHLKLRVNPTATNLGHQCLSVEVYGGPLLNSWLNRDLGLAGTVFFDNGDRRLIQTTRPVATIAQLAIHLDREVNTKGLVLNPQLHLVGLAGLDEDEFTIKKLLARYLHSDDAREIIAHDLAFFDMNPARLGGAKEELVFAPRLDNLASCHAGIHALLTASPKTEGFPMFVAFDHEEIGSVSNTGAASLLLTEVLERICIANGINRAQFLAWLRTGWALSADMVHAFHPAYPDKSEPSHRPFLGKGPAVKMNVSGRYATTGEGHARITRLANACQLSLQTFMTRGDIACGTTIGPLTATQTGLSIIDIGIPMLSMHSIRECMAAADQLVYKELLTAFLTHP